MIIYKKFFLFLSLIFLSNFYSHAAYLNPWKINDYEALKRADSMGNTLIEKQNAFWKDLGAVFKNDKCCSHKLRGYLVIIEVLDERIRGNKSLNSFDGWKNMIQQIFEKHFPETDPIFAFLLLRNMIIDSKLFRDLESNQTFTNGFRMFWEPVQSLFRIDQSIHRIYSFCEVILLIKNLDKLLFENKKKFLGEKNNELAKFSANDQNAYKTFVDNLDYAEKSLKDNQFMKEYKTQEDNLFCGYMTNTPKDNKFLTVVKGFWPKKLDDVLWSSVMYKLFENFCVNSPKFNELQSY